MFSSTDNKLPLQLYHLIAEGVRCYRSEPAAHLQDYIHYYWWLDVARGDTTLEVIPDNAIDLVMSPDIENFSILYLPVSEKFDIPLTGPISYVGISFRATNASRFFNVSHDMLGQCQPGEDTTQSLSIQALVNDVQTLTKPDQLASSLDNLLTARMQDQSTDPDSFEKLDIEKALSAMQASVGRGGMEKLAESFGLSDRQFRRIMGSLFGYGPKKVQRVMRLQAALKEIFAADALPVDNGYFDDAHKIREIRALTGLTPGQIRKMSEIYNSTH